MDRAEAIRYIQNILPYAKSGDEYESLNAALTALREQDATDKNDGRKTNAGRIRAMTDEELAEFLDKCESRGYQDSSIARDASDHCIDMLDWLKQPCGGANHE